GVRRWRSHLHDESSLHGLIAHLLVAGPGPGVAIERTLRIHGLAPTIELAVGVGLVIRGVSHHSHTGTVAHAGAFEVHMTNQEEAAIHPLAFLGVAHLAAWSHGIRLDLSLQRPRTRQYV